MNVSRTIDFDSEQLLKKLSNVGIKRSYLGNPISIYYVGYTNQTIAKSFNTGKINPVLLDRILKVIDYATDANLEQPTILTLIEQRKTIDALTESNRNAAQDYERQLENTREILDHVSEDLLRYCDQFHRASNFIKYSLNNLDKVE